MLTDAIKRRSRFGPRQPSTVPIVITDRDAAMWRALALHGHLPTPYLFQYAKTKNYNYHQDRLTQLYHGYCPNEEHEAAPELDDEERPVWKHRCLPETYLERPKIFDENRDAHYQPVVNDLSDRAWKELLTSYDNDPEEPLSLFPKHTDPRVHRLMGACAGASFQLTAPKYEIKYLSSARILAHERCPKETQKAKRPFAIPVSSFGKKAIEPDDVFGLLYRTGKYRFFVREDDRNTERSRDDGKNTSLEEKLRGYVDILQNGIYRSQLGLPNLTVLFLTVSSPSQHRILSDIKEIVPPGLHRFFAVKYEPAFARPWRVPSQLLAHLVDDPWMRLGEPLDISKP